MEPALQRGAATFGAGAFAADFTAAPEEVTSTRVSDIVCTSKLGRVIQSYSRRAA